MDCFQCRRKQLAGLMGLVMILFSYLSNGYVYADPDVLAALDAPSSTDARANLLPNEEVRNIKDEHEDTM